VSADEFRKAMRLWASGVSIVTTRRGSGLQGITVSSFCALSLEPPLVLICIAHTARSHPLIAEQRAFAVNVLREDQRDLSELAASREGESGAWLEGVPHTTAATGAPILRDCLAWIDCSLAAQHEGGDHTIYVGRVEAAGASDGKPLLYFHSGYRRLAEIRPAPPRAAARRAGPARGSARRSRAGARRGRSRKNP